MTISARFAVARAVTGGMRSALRGRTLVAIMAIAFGVALGYAIELINRSAVGELTAGLALLSGDADLEVRGPRAGFDEMLYPALARDGDVAVASPVVEVDVKLRDRDEPLAVLGVDVFRAAAINPALVGMSAAGPPQGANAPSGAAQRRQPQAWGDHTTSERLDALRGETLFPSAAAAQWLGVNVGDRVIVQAGLHDLALRVAGHAGANGGLRYAVMDIAAVQDHFDRHGRLTRIDLRLRPGVDIATVERRLQALLPPGVHVAPPAQSADATARFSRAYRVNLDVLALVALFTGAMLVYATQTLAVTRKRPQFALLRTLGLSRRRLVLWVVGEAALFGAIGAAIGLAAGYAIAWIALRKFGPDLGAGFFRGRTIAPSIEPLSLLLFAALGVAASIFGSALPAREAARAAPAAALKAADADVAAPAHTMPIASVVIAAGIGAAFLPPVADLPIFGYLAIALVLIGGILAIPAVAHAALRAVRSSRSVPGSLALAHLRATPGRFAATLAAIVASVALMVSMAIMVASFRQSLDDWLLVMLPADLYLRTGSDSAWLSVDDQRAIARVRGIARAEFMRATSVSVDPARPRIVLIARDIDPQHVAERLALIGASQAPAEGAPPPAWINEAVADRQSLAPGRTLTLPLAGRNVVFTVAGVWRDYARQQGAVVIERARYRALTGDDAVNEAALWLAPGASAASVRDEIAAYAGDATRIQAATPGALRQMSLATFDRTFAVTYALEAAAVVIGLVGLSAALVAQTLARSREFGMLRHVGMTRRQIGAMLALEGATLAAIGVAAGLLLGFAISLILVHVVNRQSFHWGMDLHVPWLVLASLSCVLLVLATLTARVSARGATSIDAVRAVREDW
ncbi:MAG TPA: ABC transporter permease [Casimicrobiaceae bacterium]|nr:ABC transporter permease [Casimicrobiaceae bacterium]